MGMRPIAIDGGEAKKELCLSMGAEAFVDFTQEKDVIGKVIEIAGGIGAHGVLVTAYQAYKGLCLQFKNQCSDAKPFPSFRCNEICRQQDWCENHVYCSSTRGRGAAWR